MHVTTGSAQSTYRNSFEPRSNWQKLARATSSAGRGNAFFDFGSVTVTGFFAKNSVCVLI